MQVEVVDALGAVLAIIDHDAKSIGTFLLAHTLRHVHQMPQHILLILAGIAQLRQPVAILGNHDDVNRGLGLDVTCE